MSPEKDKCHLTGFLPYDPSTKIHLELKKGLIEYQFLLEAASNAILYLKNREFEKFDALVGENACQIRAIRMVLIASMNFESFDVLYEKVKKARVKIEELLDPHLLHQLMLDSKSLRTVIDTNDLDIGLSSDEMFAIQSYLLCEMKEDPSEMEYMPALLLKSRYCKKKTQRLFPQISSNFFLNFAKTIRSQLSEASVQFVKNVAAEANEINLLKMTSDFVFDYKELQCTPSFWTFKALFTYARKEKIPLVVRAKFLSESDKGYRIIDEELLFYKPCPKTAKYTRTAPSAEDLLRPGCIIDGVICAPIGSRTCRQQWKNEMTQTSILDIILAYAADHRQYPDPSKTIDIQDDEYHHYRSLAEENGYSLNNPSTLFIQHMHCAQIGKVLPS